MISRACFLSTQVLLGALLMGCSSAPKKENPALLNGAILSGPHTESAALGKGSVKVNAPFPAVSFTDLDGKKHDSSQWKGAPALLMLADTTCPCVVAYNDRVKALHAQFPDVKLFYIFPVQSESAAAIKRFTEKQQYSWPIVRDEGQKLFKMLNGKCTTESFLIDKSGVLRYHGRIDDNIFMPEKVKHKDLENALLALRDGKVVPVKEVAAFACTIPPMKAPKAAAPAKK